MVMNKEEASLYLGSGDDFESQYEEKLFELKKDLYQRAPFTKLYRSKIEKIDRLNAAHKAFGGVLSEIEPVQVPLNLEGSVEEVFNAFYNSRNMILHKMNLTQNGAELIALMKQYLKLYRSYAEKWILPYEFDAEGIVISKEPDPMDLLSSIRGQDIEGELQFEDIMSEKVKGIVFEEAKRLNLWTKFEEDNGELR